MNNFQVGILAFALALSTFSAHLSLGSGLDKEDNHRKWQLFFLMLIFPVLMSGSGLWLGFKIGILAVHSNLFISLGLLSLMGLWIIFDSFRLKPDDKTEEESETRKMLMGSLSGGIAPLVVGMAIGLTVEKVLVPWIILVLLQTISLFTGFISGPRLETSVIRLRTATLGGLILLAAALEFLMKLTGF